MLKETKKHQNGKKEGAQIHPGCWYQYSIPAPFPGTHIQLVHNPETEADFLSKSTNKKDDRRPFGGSSASETCACQCSKLQGACARKQRLKWIMYGDRSCQLRYHMLSMLHLLSIVVRLPCHVQTFMNNCIKLVTGQAAFECPLKQKCCCEVYWMAFGSVAVIEHCHYGHDQPLPA